MVRRLAALLALVVVFGAAESASASPGDRDPSFGTGGVASATSEPVYTLGIEPDGSIITGRSGYTTGGIPLVRTTASGERDESYGDQGTATVEVAVNTGKQVTKLVGGPNGDVAVVGAVGQFAPLDALVAKVSPAGSPVQSFGTSGALTFDLGADEVIFDASFTPDGKLVVAGRSYSIQSGSSSAFVARLLPDGSFDPTFGTSGIVRDPVPGMAQQSAEAVSVLPDGRTEVLVDTYLSPSTPPRLLMLKPDGQLDSSFAGDGVAEVDLNAAFGYGFEPSPTGGTYVFGEGQSRLGQRTTIARIDQNGAADPSFAGGVLQVLATGPNPLVDAAGRLLIASYVPLTTVPAPGSADSDIALRRFNPDGTPDQSFGDGGLVTTDLTGYGADDSVSAAALDPQGRPILAAQYASAIGGFRGVQLVRYLADEGPPDADADGVLDDADSCPRTYGVRTDGCPDWRAEELTLKYDRRIDDITGQVSYGPVGGCSDGARVAVFRVRRGRDQRVGISDPASATTDRDPVTFGLVYQWSLSALAHRGIYYARVRPRLIEGFGHCDKLRSARYRLGGAGKP